MYTRLTLVSGTRDGKLFSAFLHLPLDTKGRPELIHLFNERLCMEWNISPYRLEETIVGYRRSMRQRETEKK